MSVKEFFCFHVHDKPFVLPGCAVRMDCSKCGHKGATKESHSYGEWSVAEETWTKHHGYSGLKICEYKKVVQVRNCVRCNYLDRKAIV